MLVYGDRTRAEDPRATIETIRTMLVRAAAAPPGIERHDALVAALIAAGGLAQGLGDADRALAGCDCRTKVERAAMTLVLGLAYQVGASWTSEFRSDVMTADGDLDALAALALPAGIDVTSPEGYAFYALYPEAYFDAARTLCATTRVIGLRSIGTSLAAMVAAGAGARVPPVCLRPVGHPFRRRIDLDPDLLAELLGGAPAHYAIVDEGPGLSGSSFGAVADRLEGCGIARARLVFFPGHDGPLGREASPHHVEQWRSADRRVVAFDRAILPRLASAVEDLTGPCLTPLHDLSGGRWRARAGRDPAAWPPIDAMQERRKVLARTASGPWLLKFVGLGAAGAAVLQDARQLHAAGFGPETLGLRLGFLVHRWEDDAVLPPWSEAGRTEHLAVLGRYLAFRATLVASEETGADLGSLAEMTRVNIGEALGPDSAAVWSRRHGDLDALPRPRPVRTDNRLHAWEWLRTPDGRWLKTDATDHCRSHDLIGCQDIAWDLAGAEVEFDLTPAEAATLAQAVRSQGLVVIEPALATWMIPAYLAFQIGLWTMALARSQDSERDRLTTLLDRYTSKLRSFLQETG